MKQILLTCLAVASSFTAFAQTDVQPVVGKYSGDLYIALGVEEYTDDAKMDATVNVDAGQTAGQVDFSLPNFSFAGMPLGDIFLPAITLNEAEGTYTFGENPDVRFNFLDGVIVADAHLDHTRSYVKGDSIVAYIPVQWVQATGNTPIYVLFKGQLANPFDVENGTFNSVSSWIQSKPWDSANGYFDWSSLEDNDEYWESAKWQMDEYITPAPWCVSHVIGMNGIGATCVAQPIVVGNLDGSDMSDEDDDTPKDYAIELKNTPNPFMATQIVPGYMTLGTSWATANVMSLETSADGGSFGGVAFQGKPDAIKFSYKRGFGKAKASEDDEEGYDASTINDKEPATVVAYLWKGTFAQADVPGNTAFGNPATVTMYGRDRNILDMTTTTGGAVTKSDDAACIASVVKSLDAADEWTEVTVPINYGEYAGTDVMPDSLNLVFSASDYFGDRSKVGAGNTLAVDNVQLVYYHALKDVTFDGKSVSFNDANVADLSDVRYDAEKLQYVKVGEGATVTTSYDESTAVLTLTVKAQDIKYRKDAQTVYTIQFSSVPDGINNVTVDSSKSEIYTIDGRRVNAMTKGVYVVNGKKVVK